MILYKLYNITQGSYIKINVQRDNLGKPCVNFKTFNNEIKNNYRHRHDVKHMLNWF